MDYAPAITNGWLTPWRRLAIVGGAILTVIGITTATFAFGQFLWEHAAERVATRANGPVLEKLTSIQAQQMTMKRQISTLARAVNEPNSIKRDMLVEQVQEYDEESTKGSP